MFYSSTFLSVIMAFFFFLNWHGEEIRIVQTDAPISFSNISRVTAQSDVALSQKYSKLTIEFFDTFACNECDRMALDIFPVLKNRYEANAEVELKLVVTPNPQNEGEMEAARGLICAGEQNLFPAMYEALHRPEAPLNKREVDLTAQGLKVDITAFRKCLSHEATQQKIEADIEYARERGVTRTPSLLINEYILTRYQPMENVERVIRKVTENLNPTTPTTTP